MFGESFHYLIPILLLIPPNFLSLKKKMLAVGGKDYMWSTTICNWVNNLVFRQTIAKSNMLVSYESYQTYDIDGTTRTSVYSPLYGENTHLVSVRGKVIKVHSVDTISISMENDMQCLVRLRFVDAPDVERYAKRSKRALEKLILNQYVNLFCVSRDRHGRLLAIAYFKAINVNWWLIGNGFAENNSCRENNNLDNTRSVLCEPETEHETYYISLHGIAANPPAYVSLSESVSYHLSPVSVGR